MPRIPTLDAPSVQPNPLPNYRRSSVASPEFLGAKGRQLSQAGDSLSAVGEALARIQAEEDLATVTQAHTALTDQVTAFKLEAQQNRQSGNAKGLGTDFNKWFDETAQKASGELGNDNQRRAFKKIADNLRSSAWGELARYEIAETKRYNTEVNIAAQASTISAGAVALTDEAAQGYAGQLKNLVMARAAADGKAGDKEYTDAVLLEATTKFHTQRLQTLLRRDPNLAKGYFDAYGHEIDGTKHAEIGDIIDRSAEQHNLYGRSQAIVSDVLGSTKDRAEVLRKIREQTSGEHDGKLQEYAIREAKERFAEEDAIDRKKQSDYLDEAFSTLYKTRKLSSIPASVMAGLDAQGRRAVMHEYDAMLRKGSPDGSGSDAQWNRYYELRRMAVSDPGSFKALDLRRELPNVPRGRMEELVDLQMKKGADLKDVATLEQQLSTAHNLAEWGSKDGQQKGQFDTAARAAIGAEEQNLGRKLKYDERQKIIDRLLLEGEVKTGKWYKRDKNVRFFEVYNTPEADAFAPDVPFRAESLADVPLRDQKMIREAARESGKIATPQEIIRKYNQLNGFTK